jgi:Domain of unknown function (DUF5005)
MKRLVILLIISTIFLTTLPAFSQCTLPASPSPATEDTTFDTFFQQNGPGWTGGDGTYSLLLPDGTNLWMWSDSYIGTVNPTTRLRSNYLFTAHNSLTIQNQTASTLTTVGYPPKTSSYFVPTTKSDWFWQGSSLLVEPTPGTYQIEIMLTQWTPTLKFVGQSVATVNWPSYTIASITPVALTSTSIEWGSDIMQAADGYYYIYGIKNPPSDLKLPYVARTTSVNYLTQPTQWTYWNATTSQWVTSLTQATPLSGVAAITPEYSVNQLTATTGTFYMLTGMNPVKPAYPDWNQVVTYYSCNPQGPWSNKTVVYTTPEAGAPGCKTGNLVTYNAKAHPEFTDSSGILLTYNVNALNSQDLVCANDYIPRFIRITIPGVTDAARQVH